MELELELKLESVGDMATTLSDCRSKLLGIPHGAGGPRARHRRCWRAAVVIDFRCSSSPSPVGRHLSTEFGLIFNENVVQIYASSFPQANSVCLPHDFSLLLLLVFSGLRFTTKFPNKLGFMIGPRSQS